MKKILLSLLVVAFLVSPVYAGKLTVGSTNNGQFTDLKVSGANSTYTKTSGNEATIDLAKLAQTDTSLTTTPVLALSQSATVAPVFGVTCTSGATGSSTSTTSTCGSYTTTSSAKVGSIKIQINGVDRYIDLKAGAH